MIDGNKRRLYGWGRLASQSSRIPQEIVSDHLNERNIVQLSSGQTHNMILLGKNELHWCTELCLTPFTDNGKVLTFGAGLDVILISLVFIDNWITALRTQIENLVTKM